jgi:hypothetical protein
MLGKKSLDTCQFDDSRTHTGGILVSFDGKKIASKLQNICRNDRSV